MNHWIQLMQSRRLFDVTISTGGRRARLNDVKIIIRDSINSAEICVNSEKQTTEDLRVFYDILGTILIDLSSFSQPAAASLTVVPNDETKDAYILTDAVAFATEFSDNDDKEVIVDVSFSYITKKALPYINI